jgi:hypothetical protein
MSELTQAFIYPIEKKWSVLDFWYFPNNIEFTLGSNFGSHPHPFLNSNVIQVTGRPSVKFSFTALFDEIVFNSNKNIEVVFKDNWGPAHFAYHWFMREMGPDGTNEAQIFVLNLLNTPREVVIESAQITPMFISKHGFVKRFMVNLSGEFFKLVLVDPRLFKKRVKKVKPNPLEKKTKENQAKRDQLARTLGDIHKMVKNHEAMLRAMKLRDEEPDIFKFLRNPVGLPPMRRGLP